jgi:hypothetical protein
VLVDWVEEMLTCKCKKNIAHGLFPSLDRASVSHLRKTIIEPIKFFVVLYVSIITNIWLQYAG